MLGFDDCWGSGVDSDYLMRLGIVFSTCCYLQDVVLCHNCCRSSEEGCLVLCFGRYLLNVDCFYEPKLITIEM